MNSTVDAAVRDFFRKEFGFGPTQVVHAPGRLELIGNHTDYNQGLVMGIAVDKYISMASSPRTDGQVELVSSAFPAKELFGVDIFEKSEAAPWANYVKGVLEQFHKRKIHFRGFNAAIVGGIPMGSGLSSSAALEVATAMTVWRYPYSLTGVAPTPDLTNQEKMGDSLSFAKLPKTSMSECNRVCWIRFVLCMGKRLMRSKSIANP